MNDTIDNHFELSSHNGFITIQNTKSGDHRTFKIETKDFGKGEDAVPKRVVSLLTGPDRDNWRDWKGFGFVSEDGSVRVWKKCRGENGERSSFEKFSALLERREAGKRSGLIYMLEGRCRRCNRALTNPESIVSGIGPICAGYEAEEGEETDSRELSPSDVEPHLAYAIKHGLRSVLIDMLEETHPALSGDQRTRAKEAIDSLPTEPYRPEPSETYSAARHSLIFAG